jgi:hypothetical protein
MKFKKFFENNNSWVELGEIFYPNENYPFYGLVFNPI